MVTKLIGSICAAMLVLLSANQDHGRFAKYKAVETYEVRPGILMMPKYAGDGQVCEIVIERHHYANSVANLDSTIPHEEVLKIVDELVPESERGPALKTLGKEYISLTSGISDTAFAEYANVSVDIIGQNAPVSSAGDIVALIRWKNRHCQ
jgi:hypothetical protein